MSEPTRPVILARKYPVHYRVRSTSIESKSWYPTKAQAIAAFERVLKRAGIAPLERYPPGVGGDSITTNELAYPRRTRAAGLREGHGWLYVEKKQVTQEVVE